MKTITPLLLAMTLASLTFAQAPAPKPASPSAPAKDASVATVIPVTAAVVSAPFVLKDGAISQPAQTDISAAGKAIFTFKVAEAGDYLIHGVAHGPDDDSNSFFVNVDAPPEDPLMIWDLEVTAGFEEHVANWRGSGEAGSGEFSPKVFKLTAGEHKLYVYGREPARLKSVSIHRVAK